jgi:low temperature requirement protein LtrA
MEVQSTELETGGCIEISVQSEMQTKMCYIYMFFSLIFVLCIHFLAHVALTKSTCLMRYFNVFNLQCVCLCVMLTLRIQ